MADNDDEQAPYSLEDVFQGLDSAAVDVGAGRLLGDAMLLQIPDELRHCLAAGTHTAVILTVPDESWVDATVASARRHLGSKVCIGVGNPKKLSGESTMASVLASGEAVLMVRKPGDQVMKALSAIATVVEAELPGPTRIADILRVSYGGVVPIDLQAMDFSNLDYFDLIACMPARGSIALAMERLAKVARKPPDNIAPLPSLDSPAFGAAGEWGRRLAIDMKDFRAGRISWADVDRGAILVGPPGTGKSQFFVSLASACEAHLIVTSVASWFSDSSGYLDGVIKAMRAVFELARRNAPCIVGFEEIEALPSRFSMDSRHREWWTAVITDFLVNLDSSIAAREGVVFVGATNLDPSAIDRAVLRPGRLERVLYLGLPDQAGLEDLFRFHLGDSLTDQDLADVVALAQLHSATAATVVEWTRAARRIARAAGRPLVTDDLIAHLPIDTRTPDELWRTAVHEAGHAVVAAALGTEVSSITIEMTALSAGGIRVLPRLSSSPTRSEIDDLVTVLLGGRAAEMLLLQSYSAGAATDLADAKKLLLDTHTDWGLTDDLVATHDHTMGAVRADMMRLHQRAHSLIGPRLGGLRRLVKELQIKKRLTGAEVGEILAHRSDG